MTWQMKRVAEPCEWKMLTALREKSFKRSASLMVASDTRMAVRSSDSCRAGEQSNITKNAAYNMEKVVVGAVRKEVLLRVLE